MLVGAAVGAVVIGGGIVIYNNREAVGDAIEKSMEMRGEAEFSAPRLYLPLPVPVLLPLLLLSPTRCPPVQNTVPITVSGWRRCG